VLLGIRWQSLRAKIFAWTFVPTVIILLAVAVVIFYAYQDVTEELVIERNRQLIRLASSSITAELKSFSDLLASEARRSDIAGGDLASQRDGLKVARRRLAVFDGGVVILDTFGTVAAAEPERPELLGQDWSDRAYYREILRAKIAGAPLPVLSDIVVNGFDGTDAIVVAVPIAGDQGQFLGVMAGKLRLGATAVSALYGDLVKLRLGDKGSAFLVDGNGRIIYHTEFGRIGEDLSSLAIVQQAHGGKVDVVRTRDADNQEIVASFAPVPGTSWSLVKQESWSSLIGTSRGYGQILILLLALGVILPTLIVTVGVRRITRPITQLIAAAAGVAEGKFGQPIAAETGDEIEELAEQFNFMSTQLKKSYSQLERRVADRTKELAALNSIATCASQSLDLDQVLNDVLDMTLRMMGIESGGIYLLDDAAGVLTIVAQRGFSPEFVSEIDGLSLGEGFSGRVAESGQPLVVFDISADPRLTREAVRLEGLRSMASVPLCSKREVLGALFAVTRGYREFSDQDVELLTAIGHQVGIAVENARLFGQVEQRMQELEALYRADERMHRHLQLDQVLQALVDVAVDILKADKSAVFTWDEQHERLAMRVAREFSPEAMTSISFARGEGLVNHVIATGEPVNVEDALADPRRESERPEIVEAVLAEGIRSFMFLPIKLEGDVFGVFGVNFTKPRAFGQDEQRLFTALAQRAALAIENAQLFKDEQRRAEQFQVISEVGHRITSILAVDELMKQMAGLIQKAFQYDHVGFGLIEGDEVVCKAGVGVCAESYGSIRVKVGKEGVWGWVAAHGEPLLVADVSSEPRYLPVPEAPEIRSQVCVPLKTSEAVIGVLSAESEQVGAFDESDLAVLQSLAIQAAVALENARLYQQGHQLAVLEERQRLARELHDAVTQTLFSASLIAEALPSLWERDQEEGRQLLRELRQLSRGALAEMRTLLLELRPAALAEANMAELLRQLGEAVTGRTGVPVQVAVEGICRFPTDVHVALYRIAQEAMNNVVKHAGARHVEVSLRCTRVPAGIDRESAERVELDVKDDGRGFDPSSVPPDRLGLGIIRERAQAMGASLQINSRPGQGTEIAVVWQGRGDG
jgi:nitrate/nitrite-specific signal transduction histidine kinase